MKKTDDIPKKSSFWLLFLYSILFYIGLYLIFFKDKLKK